jgi:hypothetical protein
MAFPALELGQLGNPALPNNPKEATIEEATRLCPGSDRLLIFVSANAIYLQLGYMQNGRGTSSAAVDWQPPKPMRPCAATLYRQFDAVRVYNYTPGRAAEVLLSVDSE